MRPVRRLTTLRALPLAAGVLLAFGAGTSAGNLQNRIAAGQSAASALRSAIAADDARIATTAGGVKAAQGRLDAVQAQLDAHVQQMLATRRQLQRARDRLVVLENRMQAATSALSTNLLANYEAGVPNLMTVILEAHGFADLLEKVDFVKRVGHQDAQILADTTIAKRAVARQTTTLVELEGREQRLADQIYRQRNQVAALHAALVGREISQLAGRSRSAAKLHALNQTLHSLQAEAAAQARAAARAAAAEAQANAGAGGGGGAPAGGGSGNGLATDPGGAVHAPAGAPLAIQQVIAAGNAIATLPYVWGGGHGSFRASGYDCSGSVSYALAAAGLLSSPLDSTGFESWGDAGPGRWITVYANAGHVFMVVAGWRFDTVALSEGGTRWSSSMTSTAGYVVRHPPGL